MGATSEISGGIAFDASGEFAPVASKFVVNVGNLKSDQPRVPVVLSVADSITLEYTFALVPKP